MQRNHTLFGSVWSSMRRKGQAPFGKRGIGKSNKQANGKMNKRYGMSAMSEADAEAEADGDFLYNSMRQVVSEGMNHITKTLMQTGGYGEGAEFADSAGDPINSAGELQTRGQGENIPLRPLVISNNNNYNMNVSQNIG